MNIFSKYFIALKNIIIYKPPATPAPFKLPETKEPAARTSNDENTLARERHTAMLRYAHRVAAMLEKAKNRLSQPSRPEDLTTLKDELRSLEEQKEHVSPVALTYSLNQDPLDRCISSSLEETRLTLARIYNLPDNNAITIRSITIPASPPVAADLVFVDGLADKNVLSLSILQPLLLLGDADRKLYRDGLVREIIRKYLPGHQVKTGRTFRDVADRLNRGYTAIFLDGATEAILVESSGQEHRGIDRPSLEQSVRGNQTAFSETLRVNIALMRSMLRTNDLVAEELVVGSRSHTTCAVLYLKSVVNPLLVREAKRRLRGISTDTIVQSGMLQLFIEDHPIMPFPQALSTERPDRVAAALSEGRLAIMLDGSSFAIVAPISLFTLFHSADDFAFSWVAGSFLRLLRLFGALITVTLPAMYIAISYFHQEALPTDLILAIGGARERVPFPSIVEIFMMEIAFELVREGGIRVPGMLGSTIGIVGAIILGQAGIAANIVSPITVVIIAFTGLASFAIPDYGLAFAIRLTRFAFEILAALFGLIGVAGGLITVTVMLCGMRSLGVPYMAPIGPKTTPGYDMVIRGPIFSQEWRPDELNPQDEQRQANISRQWIENAPAGREDKP